MSQSALVLGTGTMVVFWNTGAVRDWKCLWRHQLTYTHLDRSVQVHCVDTFWTLWLSSLISALSSWLILVNSASTFTKVELDIENDLLRPQSLLDTIVWPPFTEVIDLCFDIKWYCVWHTCLHQTAYGWQIFPQRLCLFDLFSVSGNNC